MFSNRFDEGAASMQDLDFGQVFLLGALVLLVGVFAVRLSTRFGLPTLLLYLGLGMLIGDAWEFGIQFEDAELAKTLAFFALVLILTEGGLTTNWSSAKASLPLGLLLATVGVAVSTVIVAAFAHYAFGFDWRTALLLGAITAPTDAAAVFSVLRKVPLPKHLAGALESESGLNDAPTIVLVTLLSVPVTEGPLLLVGHIGWELLIGSGVGLVVGFAGAFILRRVPLPAAGLPALAVFAFAGLAFGGAEIVAASGFAAVYVAALILGNSGLPYPRGTRSFAEGLAWLAQIGLFVMLGLLVSPQELTVQHVALAVGAGLVLTLLARPIAVVVSALPLRIPWREQTLIAWAGLRGAVPVVLATIPLAAGTKDAELLFNVVFVLVVVLTFVQAPTLPYAAGKLGLEERDSAADLDVEVAPLEVLDAELLELRIRPGSRLSGVAVRELRLPTGASVSLLVREGEMLVPISTTVLRVGDDVLVVTPRTVRQRTEDRLRAISKNGRLASWLRPPPT